MARKIETTSDFHKVRGLSSPVHPSVSLIDYGLTRILPEHIGEAGISTFIQLV